jgi:hypothetical protein
MDLSLQRLAAVPSAWSFSTAGGCGPQRRRLEATRPLLVGRDAGRFVVEAGRDFLAEPWDDDPAFVRVAPSPFDFAFLGGRPVWVAA